MEYLEEGMGMGVWGGGWGHIQVDTEITVYKKRFSTYLIKKSHLDVNTVAYVCMGFSLIIFCTPTTPDPLPPKKNSR